MQAKVPKKHRVRKESRWDDIDGGQGFIIPVSLLRHPNFRKLSCWAIKLLMDVARQFTGYNNGYLCGSWGLMKHHGWRSEATVRKAMLELEHFGILQRTRQGGKNRANLHALTWRRIDEKAQRPLDVLPSMVPTNDWKVERPDYLRNLGARKKAKGAKQNWKSTLPRGVTDSAR